MTNNLEKICKFNYYSSDRIKCIQKCKFIFKKSHVIDQLNYVVRSLLVFN